MKSEIEIAPVYHRQPERIRAYASICLLGLILYRMMRLRLAGSDVSSESSLADLRRIQCHSERIKNAAPIQCASSIAQRKSATL